MKHISELIDTAGVSKKDLYITNTSSRQPLIKELLRSSDISEDVVGDLIVIYDFFTAPGANQGINTTDDAFMLLTSLVDESNDFKELVTNIKNNITDPHLIKDLDGFLTVRFNELSAKIVPGFSMRATSIFDNTDFIFDSMEESPERDVCLESLSIVFTMFKSTIPSITEVYLNDDLENSVFSLSNAYGCINPEKTLWTPMFVNETLVVFNSETTINSFTGYINKIKKPEPKLEMNDYIWLQVVEDINKQSLITGNQCRVFVNDPYLDVKEYKIVFPLKGKPVLTR